MKRDKMKEKMIKGKEETVADLNMIEKIQPHGGVSFLEPSFIQEGDGYVRCLHIYGLPNNLPQLWLRDIFAVDAAICAIDISTKNLNEVRKNINKSITEEIARAGTSKTYLEYYDAEKRKMELQQLLDELNRMGEVVKICDFRIFLKARTRFELEKLSDELMQRLDAEAYNVTVLLHEQKAEWQSLYESFSVSHNKPLTMKGMSLTTEQLAIGFPFNHSELQDEQGSLLGFTQLGGAVVFDLFTKTLKRQYYNAIACGQMGSGKSTLLKKLFKHNAAVGNYLRVFDVAGEFANLTLEFGGKIIRCNGADGMLNPLEILRYEDDDNTNYAAHISKLQTFFKCIVPSMDDHLQQQLSVELRDFYEKNDLIPGEDPITGLDAEVYPTLSDFRAHLEHKILGLKIAAEETVNPVDTALHTDRARACRDIHTVVVNLCDNYGHLFDGHTTISDITSEKIVTFDISGIKDLGVVFTAQMQLLTSLCWDNAIANGVVSKEKWEAGNVAIEDIEKFLILIDEAHEWVNNKMPQILDMIIRYMREARKYFAAIMLASQRVSDFMPEGISENSDKIKALFELSQYKFMFRQDASAKEHIQKIFGSGLTAIQVAEIPELERGETFLAISGDRTLRMKVWLSEAYEEEIFSGGR